MEVPLFPQVGRPAAKQKSGGQKKREQNALPKVFLAAGGSPRLIFGAFVLTRACVLPDGTLIGVFGGYCSLQQPFPITVASSNGTGAVYNLRPEIEMQVRRSPTVFGDALNSSFAALAGSSWRVWPLPSDLMRALQESRTPDYMAVERKHVLAIGVEPEICASIRDVVPDFAESSGEAHVSRAY